MKSMIYKHIAYVSTARKFISPREIDDLLRDARQFNQQAGVTGVLLCHKTTFFQFFEGRPDKVSEVYERIKNSSLHTNIFELVSEPCDQRFFSEWSMGFCYIPETEMQFLAHAQWQHNIPIMKKYYKSELGINMLNEFWLRLSLDDYFNVSA